MPETLGENMSPSDPATAVCTGFVGSIQDEVELDLDRQYGWMRQAYF